MDLLNSLKRQYSRVKERQLSGRYITMQYIAESNFYTYGKLSKVAIGDSVQKKPIEMFTLGKGTIKVLMWSQMHGNESTTTKAMIDLFEFLIKAGPVAKIILAHCTLYCIPVLNPDGAVMYTRENANGADLNRDARDRLQPESVALQRAFKRVKPHLCLNLHDQRSIYGVGNTPKAATVSFLSPLQDEEGTVSINRKKSMQLIVAMNQLLQEFIPGHIGRYYDTFNSNCAGDTFQAAKVPTILFEAGHFGEDYDREQTRKFVFYALVKCLYTLSKDELSLYPHSAYFDIPENKKTFFDILIHQVPYRDQSNEKEVSLGIQYDEILYKNTIEFLPVLKSSGDLAGFYGHKTIHYKKEKNANKLLKDENILKILANFLDSWS